MDFNPIAQGSGDTSQHGQRVALVIGILQTADDGSHSSYFCSQLSLTELCLLTELIDLAGDLGACQFFLE